MILDLDFPAFIVVYVFLPIAIICYYSYSTTHSKAEDEYTLMPWHYILNFGAFCALGGGMLTVVLSIVLHFEDSTWSHCRVFNFLPSVSASIGNNTPERYIWRHAVVVVGACLFVNALIWYNSFKRYVEPTQLNVFLNRLHKTHSLINLFQLNSTYS